jgi:hypothetical protein
MLPPPRIISAFTFKKWSQNITRIVFSNVQNGVGIIGKISLNVKNGAKHSYI